MISVLLIGVLAACSSDGAWFSPKRPTIRLSADSDCPASVGKAQDVRNPRSATGTLVPPRTPPARALLCIYTGDGTPGRAPTLRRVRLGRADATELAVAIGGVSLREPKGTFNCPADFAGSETVLVFAYLGQPDIDLWLHSSGCPTLDDGRIGAFWGANPSFYNRFEPVLRRVSH